MFECGFLKVSGKDQILAFYPTLTAERSTAIGPFTLSAAADAAPAPGDFPLVLISHGSGSAPELYRTLARDLARAGFVVGVPEHGGNCRRDNSRVDTLENLAARPRQLRAAADAIYGDARLARCVRPGAVTLVGHSLGGYTALALAGGAPRSLPREAADGHEHAVEVAPDARVNGVILLAPATVWFRDPGALRAVRVSVLQVSAEKDEIAPPNPHAAWVMNGLPEPALIAHWQVANAGHFAFQSVFPPPMCRPEFKPSQDPPGFDRAAFQEELAARVTAFCRKL